MFDSIPLEILVIDTYLVSFFCRSIGVYCCSRGVDGLMGDCRCSQTHHTEPFPFEQDVKSGKLAARRFALGFFLSQCVSLELGGGEKDRQSPERRKSVTLNRRRTGQYQRNTVRFGMERIPYAGHIILYLP